MIPLIFSLAITKSLVFAQTNVDRVQNHLPPLLESQQLDIAAQAKADNEIADHYFAHTSPQGLTGWQFILATRYSYLKAGENLAEYFSDAETEETAWMNSPEHRRNILDPEFTQVGIGIQGPYTVVMFAEPIQKQTQNH